MDFEQVKEIRKEFSSIYFGKGSINAVGIGRAESGNYCIKVGLEQKDAGVSIPTMFKGVEVIVEYIGRAIAY